MRTRVMTGWAPQQNHSSVPPPTMRSRQQKWRPASIDLDLTDQPGRPAALPAGATWGQLARTVEGADLSPVELIGANRCDAVGVVQAGACLSVSVLSFMPSRAVARIALSTGEDRCIGRDKPK